MTRYLVGRIAQGVVTLWIVATIVFALMHVLGDPVLVLLPSDHTREDYDRLAHQFGYDRPLPVQYASFLTNAAQGDLGDSITYRRPALEMVAERFPLTLKLATAAVLVGLVIGIPLGMLAGYAPRSLTDRGTMLFATFGLAVPSFVVGILLILVFAVSLRWLPVGGSMDEIRTAILPVTTLAFFSMAAILRFERSGTRDALTRPFVLLARAKGLPEWRVASGHVFRNGLLPVVTFGALQFSGLLGGAVVVESVFGLPGLGRLALDATRGRDTFLVQTVVMVLATSFIVINLLTDLVYVWLDPRIRLAKRD